MVSKITAICFILFFLECNSSGTRILQGTTTTDLAAEYEAVIIPTDSNLAPISDSYEDVAKPSYILKINNLDTTDTATTTLVVNLDDYQYSGSLGLGSGVIAIIIFMVIGFLVCIYGISTEYPM